MKPRYFQTLGVNIHKSQLEVLFQVIYKLYFVTNKTKIKQSIQGDFVDVPALCAIILKGEALPKIYRSRAWLHLVLGW
jgi:hypothetical protein